MTRRERLARFLLGLPAPQRQKRDATALPAINIERLVASATGNVAATQSPYVGNTNPIAAPPMKGGRQSQPGNFNPFGLSVMNFAWRREYQDIDLSTLDVSDWEAGQLLTMLSDINPDVSKAVWNLVRMCGVDLIFKVVKPAKPGLTDVDDPVGQAMCDALKDRLNEKSGGINNIIIQLLLSAYVQGAVALDVAPTNNLEDVEDFYPVNVNSIFFARDENQVPVAFQRQYTWGAGMAPFRRMNDVTFFYTPFDAWVDDMYGRAPIAPTLQIIFFQIQVMRDLERVIHAQGWPKIDIKMVGELLLAHMPPAIKLDPDAAAKWVQARMQEIISAYNGMAAEDAFIHLDYVELSSSTVAAGTRMFDISTLMAVIRGQVISAVKQLPVVMGEHTGSTETYSTIELTIFAHTIQSTRLPVGNILAKGMELALRLQGHAAKVKPVWAAAQIYDRMTIGMAVAQEQANEAYARDQGWQTQDQASIKVTGSQAVGPAPVLAAPPTAFGGAQGPTQKPGKAPTTPNPGKPGQLQPKKEDMLDE